MPFFPFCIKTQHISMRLNHWHYYVLNLTALQVFHYYCTSIYEHFSHIVELQTYNNLFSNWIFLVCLWDESRIKIGCFGWCYYFVCLRFFFFFFCIEKRKKKEFKIHFEMDEVIEYMCLNCECLSKVQLELLDSINIKTRRKSTVRKIVIQSGNGKWKTEPPPCLNIVCIYLFHIDSSTQSIYHITSLHVKTVCRWNMNFAFKHSFYLLSVFWGVLFLFLPLVLMSVYPWHHFKLGMKLLPCFVMMSPYRLA